MTALEIMTCVLATLPCPPCQAGAKQPEAKVQVTLVVILASDRCKYIDPPLENIADALHKLNPKLTGFAMVSGTKMALPADGKGKFPCIEGTTVEVVVRQCVNANNKVCLAVSPPLQQEVVIETICGKYFLIMTRYMAAERIPPVWVARALGQTIGGGPVLGPLMAATTLQEGRCRPVMILAICATPLNSK